MYNFFYLNTNDIIKFSIFFWFQIKLLFDAIGKFVCSWIARTAHFRNVDGLTEQLLSRAWWPCITLRNYWVLLPLPDQRDQSLLFLLDHAGALADWVPPGDDVSHCHWGAGGHHGELRPVRAGESHLEVRALNNTTSLLVTTNGQGRQKNYKIWV